MVHEMWKGPYTNKRKIDLNTKPMSGSKMVSHFKIVCSTCDKIITGETSCRLHNKVCDDKRKWSDIVKSSQERIDNIYGKHTFKQAMKLIQEGSMPDQLPRMVTMRMV
jgi:hypothetical protein